LESDAARDVVEDTLAVRDQQKRPATTEMDDSVILGPAFLIIADQPYGCYSPSLSVSVAAPHWRSAAQG
jgi:hypothetical protein